MYPVNLYWLPRNDRGPIATFAVVLQDCGVPTVAAVDSVWDSVDTVLIALGVNIKDSTRQS